MGDSDAGRRSGRRPYRTLQPQRAFSPKLRRVGLAPAARGLCVKVSMAGIVNKVAEGTRHPELFAVKVRVIGTMIPVR